MSNRETQQGQVIEGKPHLHIFVNRRRFEEGDGVKPSMTGAEIAAIGLRNEREGGPRTTRSQVPGTGVPSNHLWARVHRVAQP